MKAILMIACCMIFGVGAFAQRHQQGKTEKMTGRLERMKKVLALTPEQETKIKVIDEKFASAHQKLKSDTASSVGSWHRRMSKLKTDHQMEVKSVLTEAQWTQWTSSKTAHRGGGKDRHRHGRGNHG